MLDASGIIHIEGNRFLVAEDETDILRIFHLDVRHNTFQAGERLNLGAEESDFESLAFAPRTNRFYCIGSHGRNDSRRLLQFQLKNGRASDISEIPFAAKLLIDGDIDIEGLSVWGDQLLMGYRRPSRDGLALAIIFNPDSGGQVLTTFDLQGRSFRDIVRIDDRNYLILAGPQRGRDYERLPSHVFWWNGDVFSPRILPCNIDLHAFRAEGIAVRSNSDRTLDVLIGSDESKVRSATRFRLLHCQAADIESLIEGPSQRTEFEVKL